MGVIRNEAFYSSYLGDQIDLLLAAMAQANPLPSGTDWVAFIDDCRAAQADAEAAAALAEAWSAHPPYIDPTTGDWFVYNTQTQQFVNSGVHAQGPQGAIGADGVSPKVTTTTITGGHRVTITDADHPGGQSFDVMDGGMQASTYDPQGTVAAAGGIPTYVANHAPAGGVTSFNSRTGAVTPTAGDYTAPMVGAAGQSQIAGVESSTTASQAYAIGAYFVYNGTLYRVTAAIAQGDTIDPTASTGNCEAVRLADELNTLSQEVALGLAKKVPVIGKGINLLDNWYFVGGGSQQGGGQFPINQRGQTSYSVIYGVDRWTPLSASQAVLILPTGIQILNGGQLFQYFEPSRMTVGRTYTMSVIVDGVCYFTTFTYTGATDEVHYISAGNCNFVFYCNLFDTGNNAIGWNAVTADIKIVAVKLELGDTQTLAHQDANGNWVLNDPPPNFQQELAKCQRYYQLYATQSLRPSNAQDCRPVMRATPAQGTISIGGTTYYYNDANL